MEKKKRFKIFGLKVKDLVKLGSIVVAFMIAALYLERRFIGIEHRLDRMESHFKGRFDDVDKRFDDVDMRLDKIENDVKKTGDLLNVYLTWRFLYMNDPARRNLTPRYDPNARTLEFVDKNNRVVK